MPQTARASHPPRRAHFIVGPRLDAAAGNFALPAPVGPFYITGRFSFWPTLIRSGFAMLLACAMPEYLSASP